MDEIKIRFKSGEVGYFKSLNKDIEKIFDILGDVIRDKATGVLEFIDLADNKKTIVNISEIVTFGYSYVED